LGDSGVVYAAAGGCWCESRLANSWDHQGQLDLAFTFFKPAQREGQTIGGQPFRPGTTGAPILENTPAFVECRLIDSIEAGDHSVFVGEVVDAGVSQEPEGRADEATLWLKELGEKAFYGG